MHLHGQHSFQRATFFVQINDVRRLHATVLNQMGLDPNRLTYFYSGLDQKLVGVEHTEPIFEVIS